MKHKKIEVGDTFGRWTVVAEAEGITYGRTKKVKLSAWLCRCQCGTERAVPANSLNRNVSAGYGCRRFFSDGQRVCPSCHEAFPPTSDHFHVKTRPGGSLNLSGMCKACASRRQREVGASWRRKTRSVVLNHYGKGSPSCECCGESRTEFLAIDHVNGGGSQDRKKNGNVYRRLIRDGFPDGFRILCHNCNLSLGAYGYCPHETIPDPESISGSGI